MASGDASSASAVKGRVASTEQVAALLEAARRVVIVPGYGMALAHAQHAVRELTHVLESRGIQVEFGVHPVAGRMPGHMNVLLDQVDISNEKIRALDEINPTFPLTDVALVIGANDIVNPFARTHPDTPLIGMDVLAVDRAKAVVVMKRTLGPGYAGVANPLFGADNALMLLGDGQKSVLDLIGALRRRPRVAERRVGTVGAWRQLSPILAMFRLMPQPGTRFPDYMPGQYIALRREDCRLTKRVVDHDGKRHYIPDIDEHGVQRRGPITHSYSICSAPFESRRDGHLELYIVTEEDEWGYPGRLTESLFRMQPGRDEKLAYVDRIVGDFTLEKRAKGFRNVVMVGTGTGLAPFSSMVKQLDHDAGEGKTDGVRYTLIHTNRTAEELACHDELVAIDAARRFDFVYVASVSRPRPGVDGASRLGVGRANNLLRHIVGMTLKEEDDLRAAESSGANVAVARLAAAKAVRPELPGHLEREQLLARMPPGETVVLSCGNPASMDDVRAVVEAHGMRFEKEDWKHVPSH